MISNVISNKSTEMHIAQRSHYYKIITLGLLICNLSGCFLNSSIENNVERQYQENINHVKEILSKQANIKNDIATITVEQEMQADIHTKDVNLSTLAELLTKIYDTNVNDGSLDANDEIIVSVNLTNITLNELLLYLIKQYNIFCQKTNDGYIISSPKLETKMFTINYPNFQRYGSSQTSIIGSRLSHTQGSRNFASVNTDTKSDGWEYLKKTLESIVLSDIPDNNNSIPPFVILDQQAGTIMIRAFPRAMHHAKELIAHVQSQCSRQVFIEAKILEIVLNEQFSSGIDWNLINGVAKINGSSNVFLADSNVASSSTIEIDSSKINSQFNQYLSFLVKALSLQGKVSILSSPKISLLNNQKAIMKYGNDSYYVTDLQSGTGSSNNDKNDKNNKNNSKIGFKLKSIFSGISLDTTVNIIDDNNVTLHIHPSITRVEEINKNIEINGQPSNIPVAKVFVREADTVVKSKNGAVVIIAGLSENKSNVNNSQFPGGSWFSFLNSQKKTSNTSELIILLTPIITNDSD